MIKSDMYKNLAKRERLMITREQEKLERVLGGIADLNRLPSALFVVDVVREHIAIKEAKRLNIPVFAIVDTNADPNIVDYAVPANDDAYKSILLLTTIIGKAVEEGLAERKDDKDRAKLQEEEDKKRAVDEGKKPARAVASKAKNADEEE